MSGFAPLRVGNIAPNFKAQTTTGPINFHDWIGDSWAVLFSQPGGFTLIELGEVVRRVPDFKKRNVKIIGISTNKLEDLSKWVTDVKGLGGRVGPTDVPFPIIADEDRKTSTLYGMLDEQSISSREGKGTPFTIRTVHVIDPKKVIRLILVHPAFISRNFDEIFRVIDSDGGSTSSDTLPPPYTTSPNSPLEKSSRSKKGTKKARDEPLAKTSVFDVVVGAMDKVVSDPIWSNPTVQNAISILDQLSDIGKSIPFIAPAFIIMKVIIDIERKARDVDAKCNDLLERINFMLSHLPVLRNVQVTDATRQVIERMNDVLKTAASLISAYRKQGPVARRLNMGNKDKFSACANAVNACSNDLMISLQIHQTGQLDILTRAIPVDAEDEATQSFVTQNGGVDAVTGDEKLVTEYATKMHLSMDDNVMDQINANVSEIMQQNQVQLEGILKDTVNTVVVDSVKELVTQLNEAEKEQVFRCVQCNEAYRNSKNGPASCSFHRGEYSSWSKNYPCCSTSHPCQFRSHRAKHHCEYPYGTFFERSRNILNYIDTVDTWASVEDTNLEKNATQKASVGRLLRWKSRAERINEPTIIISVGTVWFTDPYFFDTFAPKELEEIAKNVGLTRRATIFRTSDSESDFAMAEWVLSSEGNIIGVRVTAKAPSSESPYVRVCPIDISNCTKSGEVVTVSEGGIHSYKPAAPYVLPQSVRVGPELDDTPLRATRTDFKTRTTPALPLILKATSDPPLTANPDFASTDADNFVGSVSVFNKHPAGSPNPITIASISAAFRLIGDENYLPVKAFKILDYSQLPVTIDPRQSWTLKFQVHVPRSEEDKKLSARWFNRAFISRRRPLRLKLTLEDIEGEESSIVIEHVHKPYLFEKAKPDDLGFFFFDDPELWERRSLHVTATSGGDNVIRIDSQDLDVKRLQKAVYHAVKTGETEVDLGIGQERLSGEWDWGAWALVDLSCRRVYAFKIMLKQGKLVTKKKYGSIGYVLCPEYGDSLSETRSIQYAAEKVSLPALEPFSVGNIVKDDAVDDFVPEPPKPLAAPLPVPGSSAPAPQIVISEDLNRRLTSIDSNLSRIASAMEKLVDILGKANTR